MTMPLRLVDSPTVQLDTTRPTQTVAVAAEWLGVSERHLRRALEPGGDLEHLAVRIGHRVLVKTAALLALVEP